MVYCHVDYNYISIDWISPHLWVNIIDIFSFTREVAIIDLKDVGGVLLFLQSRRLHWLEAGGQEGERVLASMYKWNTKEYILNIEYTIYNIVICII